MYKLQQDVFLTCEVYNLLNEVLKMEGQVCKIMASSHLLHILWYHKVYRGEIHWLI